MALALLLRNTAKLNGARMLMTTTQLTMPKTYMSMAAVQRCLATKPLALLKPIAPITRNISLTTPKLATHSDHTTLWTIEKLVSVGLFALIPAAFVFPSPALDALMAVTVILHSHWGIAAVIKDYVRPIVVGPILPKVAQIALFIISAVSLGGLFYLVFNDIGIAKSIQKFWAIKGNEPGMGCCTEGEPSGAEPSKQEKQQKGKK